MASARTYPGINYGNYPGTNIPITNIRGVSNLEFMTEQTRQENKKREDEIRGLLDQIIGMYQPGGGFGAGTEAMLNRAKEKDVASGMSNLISSGLFGSTVAASLPKKWEEEVGMPSRLKLEDMRYGALTSALGQKAQFVENIQNLYPDYGLMAQLTAQKNSAPTFAQAGLNAFGEPLGQSFGKGVGPGASGIPTGYTPPAPDTPIYKSSGGYTGAATLTEDEKKKFGTQVGTSMAYNLPIYGF